MLISVVILLVLSHTGSLMIKIQSPDNDTKEPLNIREGEKTSLSLIQILAFEAELQKHF